MNKASSIASKPYANNLAVRKLLWAFSKAFERSASETSKTTTDTNSLTKGNQSM